MNSRLLTSVALFALTLLTLIRGPVGIVRADWGWSSEDAYFCYELMCDCEYYCSRSCAEEVCYNGCEGEPGCYYFCAIESGNDYAHMC